MIKIDILNHKSHKFMFINNDLWMWDTPREKKLQKKLANDAFGGVLVAGYGFGILQNFLSKNKKVNSITTVEKYKEIITINENSNIIGNVIIDDFYKFNTYKKYDCVIGDIWQDIDELFLKDYIKFKKKAESFITSNGKILSWGGNILNFC